MMKSVVSIFHMIDGFSHQHELFTGTFLLQKRCWDIVAIRTIGQGFRRTTSQEFPDKNSNLINCCALYYKKSNSFSV